MHKYLPLSTIKRFIPIMEATGVSKVARSNQGFLTAYQEARGRSENLDAYWQQRREALIARHEAQRLQQGEPLFAYGLPTRRHLALIAWAYSPSAAQLARY